MSGPAFTPGPWQTNCSHIYAPDGAIIAQVHNPGSQAADYPLVANRDLMAAAPELYNGCNAMLGLVQLVLGRDDLPAELREVLTTNHRIAEAEAATAKARGEQ